jgi:hypothetical protein
MLHPNNQSVYQILYPNTQSVSRTLASYSRDQTSPRIKMAGTPTRNSCSTYDFSGSTALSDSSSPNAQNGFYNPTPLPQIIKTSRRLEMLLAQENP